MSSPMSPAEVLAVMEEAARRLGSHSKESGDGDDQVSGRLGHEAIAAVRAAFSELEALRSFAQAMFDACDWPEGGDIDGFSFQELAEKHGLLRETTVTERCGEHCFCSDYGDEFPTTCYRKTPLLLGPTPPQEPV